jgi:hypothetical protein
VLTQKIRTEDYSSELQIRLNNSENIIEKFTPVFTLREELQQEIVKIFKQAFIHLILAFVTI